jgi:hypothetical protein
METRIKNQDERVVNARGFKTSWTGKVIPTELSISSATAEKLGYVETDVLYRKEVNGKKLDGYYILNSNCPVAETLAQAEELAKEYLDSDYIKMVNYATKVKFDNTCRAFLNRVAESKKAVEQTKKLSKYDELVEKLQSGEITMEDFTKQVRSCI